jgi:hypothetical protein
MKKMIKVHDGIVGALILFSVVLGYKADAAWFMLAGAVAVLMIISALTGFCPVYFLLKQVMPCPECTDKKSE